jgi:hypothetical protein
LRPPKPLLAIVSILGLILADPLRFRVESDSSEGSELWLDAWGKIFGSRASMRDVFWNDVPQALRN